VRTKTKGVEGSRSVARTWLDALKWTDSRPVVARFILFSAGHGRSPCRTRLMCLTLRRARRSFQPNCG